MKHSILFILFFILNASNLFAQPSIQWQKSFGGTNNEQHGEVCQTHDGGYIVTGISNSGNGDVTGHHTGAPYQNNDAWIIKIDSTGNIQWEKSLGGTSNDLSVSLQQMTDGNYIVAAWTTSSDGDIIGSTHGNSDFWIVKLDPTGNVIWQNFFGGGDFEAPHSIQQTSDGGFIIAGDTKSNDGDVTGQHGSFDFWILKLDEFGSIHWTKTLGGSFQDNALCIKQSTDGGYFVTGFCTSNDGDVTGHKTTDGVPDYWVVKLDGLGNKIWEKSLGGTSEDYSKYLCITPDGGCVVAGSTTSSDSDVTVHYGSSITSDFWIVRLDSLGGIVWEKTFGGNAGEEVNSIQPTIDGGFVIAGSTESYDHDVSNNHGSSDYWIIKIDSAGILEWEKSIGGSDAEQAFSIKQTTDEGYIVSGVSYSIDGDVTGNHGGPDYWIVKLGPWLDPTDIVSVNNSLHSFTVYPNPGDGEKINISLSGKGNDLNQISIYNSIGQEISSRVFYDSNDENKVILVPDNKLSTGIYSVVISNNFETIQQKLIIKSR